MELQPMSVEQIKLLIVKSKYIGDHEAEFMLHKAIYLHCCNALIENEKIRTFVTIIIASILLDQPLITQQKQIKALYKRFGMEANKRQANLQKMRRDLKLMEQSGESNSHLKAVLIEQIVAEELALDSYAEEQSLKSNRCPHCVAAQESGMSIDCKICDGTGRIAVTMHDAKAFFDQLNLTYTPGQFSSEYWNKILFIVGKLQIKEFSERADFNLEIGH